MTTTTAIVPAPSTAPAPNDPVAHTAAFFDALLLSAPDEAHSLLWTLQDKRSTWVPLAGGPDAVSERARGLADSGKDVYVAVSVAAAAGTTETRIRSANAAGIFGLWADIDIADPDVHKKWNLPPSIDGCMELLSATGLEPTLIVHSGHGLQAWWLFKEFWEFTSEENRLEAAGLAQRWNATLQGYAAERAWVVDSVYDLARVMRVPGTLNRKGSPVMPVRLLKVDGPRYEAEDIEVHCRDESAVRGLSPARSYKPDDFEPSESNKVDLEKLEALLDNVDGFRATYDMKRRDFIDQSPSSYDLSLASFAARSGWSDWEIGALIFRFRQRHKLDTAKALRADYIYRTIAKARDGLARDVAVEEMEEAADALEEAIASGDPDEARTRRRALLDKISARVGIEWVHFIKYDSEPPAYAGQTPTKLVPLGDADGILQQLKFRKAVAEYTNEVIDRMKQGDWDEVARLIFRCLEVQDVGAEATERGELAAWLSAYLSQRPPVDALDEAASSEYPFCEDDRVVLFGPAFKRWLWLTYQERVTNKELGRKLRAFGCEPDKVNITEKTTGKRTTRGVWRLPKGWGL